MMNVLHVNSTSFNNYQSLCLMSSRNRADQDQEVQYCYPTVAIGFHDCKNSWVWLCSVLIFLFIITGRWSWSKQFKAYTIFLLELLKLYRHFLYRINIPIFKENKHIFCKCLSEKNHYCLFAMSMTAPLL